VNILSLLGSKASLVIIGVLMVALTWGSLKLRIWRLEGLLAKERASSALIGQQRQMCQSDLGALRLSFFEQNKRIDQLQQEAAALALAAEQAARQMLTSPDELEEVLRAPPGHAEMNRFMADLIKEGG